MATLSNSGNLYKSRSGQILKITLEPLVLELCVIPLVWVFEYEESISDVKCSVQGQDQMPNVR